MPMFVVLAILMLPVLILPILMLAALILPALVLPILVLATLVLPVLVLAVLVLAVGVRLALLRLALRMGGLVLMFPLHDLGLRRRLGGPEQFLEQSYHLGFQGAGRVGSTGVVSFLDRGRERLLGASDDIVDRHELPLAAERLPPLLHHGAGGPPNASAVSSSTRSQHHVHVLQRP